MDYDSPQNTRQGLAEWESRLVKTLPLLDPTLEEFYATTSDSDGQDQSIALKIIRPKSTSTSPRPLIILFHGGGFFCGSSDMMTRPGREFALECNAVVVLPTYRLAPEHRFPTAMMDGWHVVDWLLRANPFGGDPKAGVIVGGYSAGAHLAAVLTRQSKREIKPFSYPITGCFLGIPSIGDGAATIPKEYMHLYTSRQENDTPENPASGLETVTQWFRPDTSSPWFSPFNSPHGLAGMPPTYIQVCGKDLLRDDGVVFAKALQDAGVDVKLDCYDEMSHGGYTVWAQGEGVHNPPMLRVNTVKAMKSLLGQK